MDVRPRPVARPKPEDGHPARRRSPTAYHAHLPRQTSGSPGPRRDGQESPRPLLLARRARLDRTICQGVHSLPTKQESYTQDEAPPVQNHGTQRQPPFLSGDHGPDHGTPKKPRPRQHTNHCRPWVLPGRHLPPLPENDYGPPNCAAVLPAPLPMVRTPPSTNLRSRPPFYVS